MIKIKSISEITKYADDLQAIIFDLDNVLYPLDDYVQSGFHQICRLFLGRGQVVYDQLWSAYQEQNVVDRDAAVAGAIHAMIQAQNLDTDEMHEKCLRIYEQHRPSIQPYDGVVELLEQLRDRGICLGMLIDGPAEMQWEKLRALGIMPLFDEVLVTDDIAGHGDVMKFRKPNRICFEIMQLRLDEPFARMAYVCDDYK